MEAPRHRRPGAFSSHRLCGPLRTDVFGSPPSDSSTEHYSGTPALGGGSVHRWQYEHLVGVGGGIRAMRACRMAGRLGLGGGEEPLAPARHTPDPIIVAVCEIADRGVISPEDLKWGSWSVEARPTSPLARLGAAQAPIRSMMTGTGRQIVLQTGECLWATASSSSICSAGASAFTCMRMWICS
jgi:hypothetical protein